MILFLKLSFALIVIALSGRLLLLLIDRAKELEMAFPVRLAFFFTLGLGLLSIQMFCYSLVGISFSVSAISLPWIAASIVHYIYVRGKSPSRAYRSGGGQQYGWLKSPGGAGIVGWISILIITVQVSFAFFSALLMPFRGWDAWAIWFIKAKVFFIEGAVSSDFLGDASYGVLHLDYPLLLPLAGAWIYLVLGSVHEIMAKILFPVQFVSMLAVFFFIVARGATAKAALLFTALLSLVPLVMTQAGGMAIPIGGLKDGDYVGYADITIALFFMSAAGLLYLYMTERKAPYLIISAMLLGFGAWTKNEGLAFAVLAILTMAVYLFMERMGRKPVEPQPLNPRLFLAFFVIPIAIITPWVFYKAALGLGSEYTGALTFEVALENLHRLPYILKTFFRAFFVNYELVSLTWYAYIISSIVGFRRSLSRPMIFLHAMIIGQLLIYILVYIVNPHDLELSGLMDVSVIKRTLQILPLAMLVASINISALFFNTSPLQEPQ